MYVSKQSPRIFIPVGACVEKPTAALFTSPETNQEAIEACAGCVQLEHCKAQRDQIGDAIALGGVTQAVVGGEVLELKKKRSKQLSMPYFEHREPTFTFNFRPLPTDGERGLWAIQQAYRLGQLYGRKRQHPSIDVGQLFADSVQERDEFIFQHSMETPEARSLITTLVLSAVALRKPCGDLYPGVRRYSDFEPEAYSDVIWQYALQAARLNRLGLPPERAAVHNPDFYATYFQDGLKAGVTRGLLRTAANGHKRWLLPAAERMQQHNIQEGIAKRKRRASTQEVTPSKALQVAHGYNIVQTRDGIVDLHADLHYLDHYERAAVLYTYNLQDHIDPGISREDLQKQLKDPVNLTHTVILPSIYAERFANVLAQRGAIDAPQLTLRHIRSGLWTGRYRTAGKDYDNIDGEAMYAMFREGGWVKIDEHRLLSYLVWLKTITERYFIDQDREVPEDVFHKMGTTYIRDVRMLQRAQQVDAERVGLFYSPTIYQAIREYGVQKYPEVSASVISQGFLRNIRTPLRLAAQTTAGYHELRPVLAEYDFADSAIKRLAIRGIGKEEARQVAQLTRELIEETRGILPSGFISNHCAARSFNPDALRAEIHQRALKKKKSRRRS